MKCYVLKVLSGNEIKISNRLRQDGFTVYVPREDRLIRSHGHWINREYVLFTGYVFIDLEFSAVLYHQIKGIIGNINFLELHAGNPSALTDQEQDYIHMTCKTEEPLVPSIVEIINNKPIPLSGILKEFSNSGTFIKYNIHRCQAFVYIPFLNDFKRLSFSFKIANKS
jgi:transcriptional antiterminator NusG